MQSIHASAWLPYPPIQVFAQLTDPDALVKIIGRLQRIEPIDDERATITLAIPFFGQFSTQGTVVSTPPNRLRFGIVSPLQMSFDWQLTPEDDGTRITIDISSTFKGLDLPMAREVVKNTLKKDLEQDINTLADLLRGD